MADVNNLHGVDIESIYSIVEEEERSGIPSKGLGHYTPRGFSSWDKEEDAWYFKNDNHDYLYLEREGGYHVTVQRCNMRNLEGEDKHFWNVYIEKDITDGDSVHSNQTVAHTFRWVRSLKHAMYLGEVANEVNLQVAHYEDFFLTNEEWNRDFN